MAMTKHPNLQLAEQAFDALNEGDVGAFMDILDDDVVWHEIGRDTPIRGKQALADHMQANTGDWGIEASNHDVLANDEHVVALAEAKATRHGKTLDYRTVEIMHVRNGKITERWSFGDDSEKITEFFR